MSENTITDWIIAMRAGDPDAAERLWSRFVVRVRALARSRITEKVRRHRDEDDIAQSALHALWTGAQQGRFDSLSGREELWRLLAVITIRKAANATRAAKDEASGESVMGSFSGVAGAMAWIGEIDDSEFAGTLDHACRDLMDALDPVLRPTILLRFQGYTNEEIARLESKSVRTIERYVKMARRQWEAVLSG